MSYPLMSQHQCRSWATPNATARSPVSNLTLLQEYVVHTLIQASRVECVSPCCMVSSYYRYVSKFPPTACINVHTVLHIDL